MGTKQPSDDAGHTQRGLLAFGQLINAAEDQGVQAVGQFDLVQVGGVAGVEPTIAQIVEQFFQIERVALRARHESLHQQRWHRLAASGVQLGELGADGQLGFGLGQLMELNLGEGGQGLQPRRLPVSQLGRAIGQHKTHGIMGQRPGQFVEQSVRNSINPMQIFNHQEERLILRRGLQTVFEQCMQSALPAFRLKPSGERIIGYLQIQQRAEQGQRFHAHGRAIFNLTFELPDLFAKRQFGIHA